MILLSTYYPYFVTLKLGIFDGLSIVVEAHPVAYIPASSVPNNFLVDCCEGCMWSIRGYDRMKNATFLSLFIEFPFLFPIFA